MHSRYFPIGIPNLSTAAVVAAVVVAWLAVPFAEVNAAEPCPVSFNIDVTHLGHADTQLLEAMGPPLATFEESGPSRWLLYDLHFNKGLKYGQRAVRLKNFSMYDWTFYYLDASRRVVGFTHLVSDVPSRLMAVKDAHPWAVKLAWDKVHQVASYPAPSVLATRECGKLLIMLFADCYPVIGVDPKTYKPTERQPQSLGECRYRGLFLHALADSVPNSRMPYQPYRFAE